jgi:transcriptional regulator with XRE-family HTH domain
MSDSNLDSCPTAPHARATVQTRVLHRACQKLGGVEQLARFLNVPAATVYRWLEGESVPPTAVFLKAVDIVMPAWSDEDEALSRELLSGRPRAPEKKS